MNKIDCDIAILGSGFGGTLLALIARKLGYSVALLERGSHPRFAIGESSTPLADFKLASIADSFDLDWLRPFAKYGSWKARYPEIHCGLKRGFSFFRHEPDSMFAPQMANANCLLVAANPDEAGADTHWFRADFDAHLVARAVNAGVIYRDNLEVDRLTHEDGWTISGKRPDGAVAARAGLLIDATGAGQLVGQALSLQAVPLLEIHTRSRVLYSHFTGVARWQEILEENHGTAATAKHPFPCDAAALHHIIDNGWMWVLRFDHGITSAGFSLDPEVHPIRADESPNEEWRRLLAGYPALARQFDAAQPVQPFVRTARLQRRSRQAAGPNWAMLPHAAGFLDAWLSPGIAQTLFAVSRLGHILAEEKSSAGRSRRLDDYGRGVLDELAWMDQITGACFDCFDRFEVLTAVTMLYFVAAQYCEERERAGCAAPDAAFLLADEIAYRDIAAAICRAAPNVSATDAGAFARNVRNALAPYNVCGMCDPGRRNMYPFV